MFDNLTTEGLIKTLRSMTVDQLKTACKNWIDERTKRQLIILIMALKTLDIDNWQEVKGIIREGDARGPTLVVDEVRDVLGNKLRLTRLDYTYYPAQSDGTQPRDTIIFTEMDADDRVISVKKLKHYSDGRQPEWIE